MRKVEVIRQKISDLLQSRTEFTRSDLEVFFPEHKSMVAYAIKDALKKGRLVKLGSTRNARYQSAELLNRQTSKQIERVYVRGEQTEEVIFRELQQGFLNQFDISENAKNIVSYSFTEMVNNAIDHSGSDNIEITMGVEGDRLRFTVRDFGIGAFRNVMEQRGLADGHQAAAELTKGKVTTAPKWHSGEGVFFTSRAADFFRLSSGGLALERRNGRASEVKIVAIEENIDGTLVEFAVDINTDRHLAKDVFGQFTSADDDHDFGKTEIAVSLFERGDVHVSRSQAKRIMAGLDKFKVVVLDFSGITMIGQGFADQIFRIFRREHPQVHLTVRNAVPDVQFMIDRVQREG